MTAVSTIDIIRVLPEAVLSGFAVLVMVLDPFIPPSRKGLLAWLSLAGVIAAEAALFESSLSPGLAFNGTVSADPFSFYFIFLFLLVAALTVLGSMDYLERDKINRGEFYALVLMATVGACFMAASTELIMVFIGLEISSISTYILAGFRRNDAKSNEASLKYFLLGSFATAFFLYGIAFVYGLTGTTKLVALSEQGVETTSGVQGGRYAQVLTQHHLFGDPHLLWLAMILLFVGLAFKVSTVPFQVWTPDVYQGAPAPVTAFLSVGPKAAAFAAVLRIFLGGLAQSRLDFSVVWIASAVLTMSLGNLAALWQSNVKRLLAYSAIAHAGYVLVGISAATVGGVAEGTSAVLFYLLAYSLMNLGAFVLIAHLAGAGERRSDVEDYVGLAYKRPGVAACLTVFLLSLGGLPTTAGFLAKFYVFRAAVHSHLILLTVVAVLNSVVSVYYYLRLVVVMYMREGEPAVSNDAVPWPLRAALAVSVVGIFYLGLFPNAFLSLANLAANPLPYFNRP